ncbi:MAG: hypothetical protein EOP04_07335 [Proteobacteria bacterium]|nr:MAG: hypothetical protein EOP04_07335 [Pseudomonadota bacterium]
MVIEVIIPTLSEALAANDFDIIIFALQLHAPFWSQLNEANLDWNTLIKRGRAFEHDNLKILEMLYYRAAEYIDFTVHEIPAGVLWDMNGASILQCQELLENLEEFEN